MKNLKKIWEIFVLVNITIYQFLLVFNQKIDINQYQPIKTDKKL